MTKISTLDSGYQIGDLSLYPDVIDDKSTLYEAKNNAQTILKHSLSYNGKNIIVNDASMFPDSGILKLYTLDGSQSELIYYSKKTNNTFSSLQRAFAGSKQGIWPSEKTIVANSVMAEHHNAVRDAIYNIEKNLGVKNTPESGSLNGMLKSLENKHLSPKPLFRAYPIKGGPNLQVRFQNFSSGDAIRYLWDFGDGVTSVEKHPTHTYTQEGLYTVKLNIITSTGSQGVSVKNNYINVSVENKIPFFYVEPQNTLIPNYSVETAGSGAQVFNFVDQSDGNIIQRYWVFDDGENESQPDPDIHFTTHIYNKPGIYRPSLLLIKSTQKLTRVFLTESIEIV